MTARVADPFIPPDTCIWTPYACSRAWATEASTGGPGFGTGWGAAVGGLAEPPVACIRLPGRAKPRRATVPLRPGV